MPSERFVNRNVDLSKLSDSIEIYCQIHDFKDTRKDVDPSSPPSWFEIQARKKGIVRTVVGARRCLDIVIKGRPEDFEVVVGTGDWGKNIAASLITGTLTLGLGFIGAGASAAAYKHFENQLMGFIKTEVDKLENTYTAKPVTKQEPSKQA